MIYIKGNHIMITDGRFTDNIRNTTGYPPERVYGNTVLLSNGKLYTVVALSCYYLELSEIELESSEYYCICHADFTDKFVRINSDYYKISDIKNGNDDYYPKMTIDSIGFLIHNNKKFLQKIPIVAKNSQCIVKLPNATIPNCYYYYYIDADNNLVLYDESHTEVNNNESDTNDDLLFYDSVDESNTHLILNTDIDLILYHCVNDGGTIVSIVVQKKILILYVMLTTYRE